MNISINNADRLVLGTAQLGMYYGIANSSGKPDQSVATAIISEALAHGICQFDTAQGYGDSEDVLGRALADQRRKERIRIVSKLPPVLGNPSRESLRESIEQSILKLGVNRLSGLMLHREDQLELWDHGLGHMMSSLVKDGLVEQIGVSVYSPEKALQALEKDDIHIIQVPSNILDARFENSGVFYCATRLGKTVYVRSIFLQGLLLMEQLPQHMHFASGYHNAVRSLAREFGITVCELALWYAREAYPQAKIVFGVDTPSQIQINVQYWAKERPSLDVSSIRNKIGNVPERVLNPSLW